MNKLRILLLAFLASAIVIADETTLIVSSSTPEINIATRSSDRYSIRLPGLQYDFQLELVCATGYEPDSVLLSVADTKKRIALGEGKANSDDGISMKIPASQIAPLSVEGFCLASENDDRREPGQVTVRGVLSAQASLLCSGEDGQQLMFASQSLDVTLRCDGEADN
jgi:hypothetical protein